MIRYDVSHWTITDGKTGLLLFAQSLEELLAIHSHDSHKVPALNFHYLGYEILSVIDLIEDDVLDRGNLIPLLRINILGTTLMLYSTKRMLKVNMKKSRSRSRLAKKLMRFSPL